MRFLALILSLLTVLSVYGQTGQEYTVKGCENLKKVAANHYQAEAAAAIMEATNAKANSDSRFTAISEDGKLKKGQVIWLPGLGAAQTDDSVAGAAAAAEEEATIVAIPKTNCEIRIWYNYQVVAIGPINDKWTEDGIPLEKRAHQAYEMRHQARVNARFMMQNKKEVKELQARDMKKYGNPDGPTFDYLVEKNTKKGLSKEEAWQSIVDSSSRTSAVYNKECE